MIPIILQRQRQHRSSRCESLILRSLAENCAILLGKKKCQCISNSEPYRSCRDTDLHSDSHLPNGSNVRNVTLGTVSPSPARSRTRSGCCGNWFQRLSPSIPYM